jgi:hypothetical protein
VTAPAAVDVRSAEQDGHLQREHDIAVQILVQAVVAALLVAQEQWGRAKLARTGAHRGQAGKVERVAGHAQPGSPPVRDRGERRVQPLAQVGDDRRQRTSEVPVRALAGPMPCHRHRAPERLVHREQRADLLALRRGEQGRRQRVAVPVERGRDRSFIHCVLPSDPSLHYSVHHLTNGRRVNVTKDLFDSLDLGFAVLSHPEERRLWDDHAALRAIEDRLVVEGEPESLAPVT